MRASDLVPFALPAADELDPAGDPMSEGPVAPMSFDEQVRKLTAAMDPMTRIVFLAGVRFHAGFAEYGDALFTKPVSELEWDAVEEAADKFTYEHAIKARETP